MPGSNICIQSRMLNGPGACMTCVGTHLIWRIKIISDVPLPQQQMQALFISQIPRPSIYSQMITSFPEWAMFIWYLLFTNFTACKNFRKLSFKWINTTRLGTRHISIMHLTVLTTSVREFCVLEIWRWKGLIQPRFLGKAHFAVGAPRIRVDRGMDYLTGGTSMQSQEILFEIEIDKMTSAI